MEPKFNEMFAEAFRQPLTARQLWVITLFAKRVRKYARQNTAFNNLANRAFPHARFRQVPKERPSRTIPGTMEKYEGLQINVKGEDFTPSEDLN